MCVRRDGFAGCRIRATSRTQKHNTQPPKKTATTKHGAGYHARRRLSRPACLLPFPRMLLEAQAYCFLFQLVDVMPLRCGERSRRRRASKYGSFVIDGKTPLLAGANLSNHEAVSAGACWAKFVRSPEVMLVPCARSSACQRCAWSSGRILAGHS